MVVMGVGIDKARRNDLSTSLQGNGRLRLRQIADGGDKTVANTDIRIEAGLPCPVYDRSATNNDVERTARLVSRGEVLSLLGACRSNGVGRSAGWPPDHGDHG